MFILRVQEKYANSTQIADEKYSLSKMSGIDKMSL